MEAPKTEVADFFNTIAGNYRDKYSGKNAFLYYFFNERLDESTRGFDFRNKKILDVGAGTGNLYDRLLSIEPSIEYYATDIAGGMLEQSLIPPERRFVGRFDEIALPVDQFDYIFLLGVTTYLDDEELTRTLEGVASALAPDGRAVVTFTNQGSLDWKTRRVIKAFGRNLMPKRYVLSQDFRVYPRSLKRVEAKFGTLLSVEDVRWLNHTVFPFNQLARGPSVALARKIHRMKGKVRLKSSLSSDFLVVFSKSGKSSRTWSP